MKTSNIIVLPSCYQELENPVLASQFPYDAYERRAVSRFRRASICAFIVSTAEALVTAAIGACIVLSTLVFISIL